MSSTVVYQELLLSQHHHQSSSLNLKLVSNPSKLTFSSNQNCNSKSGFSAIEALSSAKKHERESEYIHPLAKRSSYSKMMSEKSLEMCTESLGSETGAFFTESHLYFPTTTTATMTTTTTTTTTTITNNNNNDNISNNNSINKNSPRQNLERKDSSKFPPPLTTMMGSTSLQVRPYREDGRLVIEAVSAPSSNSSLTAERSDGRLRLSLVRHEEEEEEEEEEEIQDYIEEREEEAAGTRIVMEGKLGLIYVDDEGEEEEEEEEEERERKEGGVKLENMNGILVEFGGKMGKGDHEFQRASSTWRCKEGGRGNINKRLSINVNWGPFCVAT